MASKQTNPRVAWSKLEHASGEATRIGELLTTLRKGEPSERDWAFERLEDWLIENGRIFSASVAAVPALIALASSKEVPDRGRLLGLAFDIVTVGEGRWAITRSDNGAAARKKKYGRGLPKEAYAAARGELDRVAKLLGDRDPAVRAAAAYGLSVLLDDAAFGAAALDGAARAEEEPHVRGAMLFALAQTTREAVPKGVAKALRAQEDLSRDPFSRSAAVVAALLDGKAALRDQEPDLYVPFLAVGALPPEVFPFHDGVVAALGSEVLRSHKATGKKLALAALERALTYVGADQDAVGDALIEVAFGYTEEARAPGDLTEEQRALLTRLADLPISPDAFVHAGLPATPDERKRYLGLAAPRPLDRLVKKGKSEVPLWKIVADLQDKGANEAKVLAAIADAVPSKVEMLKVIAEIASSAHGLRPVSGAAALQAFATAGPAAADVARTIADQILARYQTATHLGAPPDFINAVLVTLLRSAGNLDIRYAPIIQVVQPEDVTEELLRTLPVDRREALLLQVLEPQWERPTRSITNVIWRVTPYLVLAPTGTLAARLLEMTEQKRLAVIDSAREAALARSVVLDALRSVANESREVKAALERAGVA